MNINSANYRYYPNSYAINPAYTTYCTNGTFCGKKILTEPIVDIYCFYKKDKSLSPQFLKSLLEITQEQIGANEKIIKLKNKFLISMGYKQPDQLKIIFTNDNTAYPMAYNPILGNISVKTGNYSPERTISDLRHELEHMDQFIKIYKAKGKNSFLSALLYMIKQSSPNTTIDMATLSSNFNELFYNSISENVSLKDFDAEKYYKAMYEYTQFDFAPSKAYKYFNNLLEKDAYAIERKVLTALGKDAVVSADQFPKNYKVLIKLLNNSNIPIEHHDNVLQVMNIAACLKNIETPENVKKYLKLWKDVSHQMNISKEDESWYKQVQAHLDKVLLQNKTKASVKFNQELWLQVETWFRDGKFFTDDLIDCT